MEVEKRDKDFPAQVQTQREKCISPMITSMKSTHEMSHLNTDGQLQGRYSQEWLNSQNKLIDCSDSHKCMC